jgi:hypothetical protein
MNRGPTTIAIPAATTSMATAASAQRAARILAGTDPQLAEDRRRVDDPLAPGL